MANAEVRELPVLEYGRPSTTTTAPVFLWLAMLMAAGMAQLLFLPCLCGDSDVKLAFAGWLDVAYVLRGVLALLRRERGSAWLIHGVILFSSAFWIEAVLHSETVQHFYGMLGLHPYSYYLRLR